MHSKQNLFDSTEYSQTCYRSPIEMEIELKKQEIVSKEKEVNILLDKYDKLTREYTISNQYIDTSQNVCKKMSSSDGAYQKQVFEFIFSLCWFVSQHFSKF